ncbi:MAG: putative ATP-dependent ligase [Actinomycetia bacterium]|nr:putative ATP-dependent ligase [Actinomycetes bacterium]
MTLLAELVAASDAVAATSKRTEKVAALASLLQGLAPDEVEVAVGMLTGAPRQRRTGVAWRTVQSTTAPPAAGPSLTIVGVDAALTALEACAGAGSQGERNRLLTELLAAATEAEQWFLRRLLVGELRQGALAGVMNDAVAKASGAPVAAVRRAAMLSGDLAHTAGVALVEGGAGLDAVHLEVLRPLLPMLAASSPDVGTAPVDAGAGEPVAVQWTLDGARIQVHRRGDEVGIWTRNLNEITERLPGIVAGVRALPATAFVLDGEAMGWGDDERPGVFQETMSSFGSDGASLGARFFDVLHVDGRDLVDEPLSVRHAALDALVGPHAIPRLVTSSAEEATAFAEDALARGHEGVMVKSLSSPYEAGRRGSAWRKVKPVRTLDLVVLAVEWGSGRRRGWLSNLWLGARGDDGYVMVGKTFKGMTDALLEWQTKELLAREVSHDGHVVHVRPELVVEIALDGVQRSTRYAGGVALRFARVKRYRDDKDPSDADTIDAVRALLVPTGRTSGG